MTKKVKLPNGWLEIDFAEIFLSPGSDIVDGPFGSNLKASEYVSKGVPIARLQNIDRNHFIAKNTKYVTKKKSEELARHTFVPGDILITKLGDPLGKACFSPPSIVKGVLVADVVRARLTHTFVDARFLCYQINSEEVVKQFTNLTKGTTRPRVNLTKIRSLKTKICSQTEQIRIVEKLEELLSDLEAGVAELKAAQKKLGQYRQSLLKAAVEGTLTAEWRKSQKTKIGESGAKLLQRILRERRAHWEALQLAKFEVQGKVPPKDWQAKYTEPVAPQAAELSVLPQGWVWVNIDQLAHVGTGVTPLRSNTSYFHQGTIPWITSGALNDETVSAAKEFVTEFAVNKCRLEVYPEGSILVAMYGEGKTRGKCSELLIPATINQAIAALVMEGEAESCKAYLKAFLLHSYEKLREQASGGVQPNLNLQIIKTISLPLPPVSEQAEVVRLLAQQFDQIERQQNAVRISLKQSAAQRKNILQAAFSGQLVRQDPSDEPASELLKRIRAERAASISNKTKRPSAKKSK